MPQFFGNGMVLQREARMPIWGWAQPGSKLTVSITDPARGGKAIAKAKAITTADGEWKVYLPKQKAGGPYKLNVADGNATKLSYEVYIGDVFLFSGQSNQELPIRRCMDKVADLVKDYTNDHVHILKIPQQHYYSAPQKDCKGAPWVSISPETCSNIAALSYFVGRELQEQEGVHVGIINSSVGGTRVECWMSRETLSQFPEYDKELQHRKYFQKDWADSIARLERARSMQWERSMNAADTVMLRWNKPGYDFSAWQKTNIFTDWTKLSADKRPHGSYWFRQTVSLPASQAGKEATLRIGAMKDADSVFVNGTFVGNTTYEYPPRIYKVPAGILREGENSIVVRLMAQKGRPNFTKGKLYQLEVGNDIYTLPEEWLMACGTKMDPQPGSTYFVDTPTGLFNAMINPYQDLAIRGAVWYQGESNLGNSKRYSTYLEALIAQWRSQFTMPKINKSKEIPFVIVQLPGYMGHHDAPHESSWCDIRTQQRLTTQETADCMLAAALDGGEHNDIHPQDKNVVGHRITLLLRNMAYGDAGVCQGPEPLSAVDKGDGRIVVTFSEKTGKLRSFKDACAEVTGDYELTIKSSELNKSAIYTLKDGKLRYAHDDFPTCTIFNTDGLPSPQFEIAVQTEK